MPSTTLAVLLGLFSAASILGGVVALLSVGRTYRVADEVQVVCFYTAAWFLFPLFILSVLL